MTDPQMLPSRRSAPASVAAWGKPWWTAALLLWLGSVPATQVCAQPRIGLSASKDAYVEHVTVPIGAEFQLHAMVFGSEPGAALNQEVSSLPWVIHQACCGAVIEILDIEFNPELEHVGHPLAGIVSSVETCLDRDSIWLATLTVGVVTPQPEDVLWPAGPFGPILDCAGESPFFLNMPVTITVEGEPTPTRISPWGQIKAMYR